MDNVILLDDMLKDFVEVSEQGSWIDSEWVPNTNPDNSFKAVPIPKKDQYMLNLIASGAISTDSIKIYSHEDLDDYIDKRVRRVSDSKIYKLIKVHEYDEIADIHIYVLDRVEGG